MDTEELVLLLAAAPGIGDRTIAHILRRLAVLRSTPDEFLHAPPSDLQAEFGLRADSARRIESLSQSDREAACELARYLRRAGIVFCTVLDASYPRSLVERLADPPPALYLYGAPGLLNRPLFAVANSNGAPESALAATDALARIAVQLGIAPVTGTNRPAYQRPALVARRAGSPVCYVLDRGLLDEFGGQLGIEPVRAARVWQPAYDAERDLTLSCFSPYHHALATHNRRRDEVLFALASCVIAGHVRPGGQMDRQCRAALGSGVPVFVAQCDGAADCVLQGSGATPLDPRNEEAVAAALSAAATAAVPSLSPPIES